VTGAAGAPVPQVAAEAPERSAVADKDEAVGRSEADVKPAVQSAADRRRYLDQALTRTVSVCAVTDAAHTGQAIGMIKMG
jgi:hypothetical protein